MRSADPGPESVMGLLTCNRSPRQGRLPPAPPLLQQRCRCCATRPAAVQTVTSGPWAPPGSSTRRSPGKKARGDNAVHEDPAVYESGRDDRGTTTTAARREGVGHWPAGRSPPHSVPAAAQLVI